jgi:hypothetical protein
MGVSCCCSSQWMHRIGTQLVSMSIFELSTLIKIGLYEMIPIEGNDLPCSLGLLALSQPVSPITTTGTVGWTLT